MTVEIFVKILILLKKYNKYTLFCVRVCIFRIFVHIFAHCAKIKAALTLKSNQSELCVFGISNDFYVNFLNMKNKFLNLLFFFAVGVGIAGCDDPEVSMFHQGVFENVFDVKMGSICPAFSDDEYTVNNLSEMGLREGDRAYLKVSYVYDVYSMPTPYMNIEECYTKVPFLSMSKKGSFDKKLFNSPLAGIAPIYFFTIDGQVSSEAATYIWADDATQNVAVRYDKNYVGEFKMTLDSVRESVAFFRLYANLSPANGRVDSNTFPFENDPDQVCKILSFKMDWDMLRNELSTADMNAISAQQVLTSCISVAVEGCKTDEKGMYIPNRGYTIDKFKNPLYTGN